jgi:hypothetical protein
MVSVDSGDFAGIPYNGVALYEPLFNKVVSYLL